MKLKQETYYLLPVCPPTESQAPSFLENANTTVQLIFEALSAYALGKKLGGF
jgi:hypothetical protein